MNAKTINKLDVAAPMPHKPDATGYTGHDSAQAGIQKHSMGDSFSRYQIIMAFAPLQNRWIAMRNGVELGNSPRYDMALGIGIGKVLIEMSKGV